MEALTAYATHTQRREWRTTPVRLKVVPTEHVSAVELAEAEQAATRRLPAAIAR